MPGQAKTRLCPPLSPDEAAGLSRSFLLDKIEQVRALERATPVLAYTPEDSRDLFAALAPDFVLLPQQGPDLGARLSTGLERLLASDRHGGVLLIDSDTPTLPVELLQRAVDLLADPAVDIVLGPTEDGGYYLIGLKAPQPALFVGMPWSTPEVLPETLRRARLRNLRLAQLPSWHDVDVPSDLDRLRAELAGEDGARAAHTRRFLGIGGCENRARPTPSPSTQDAETTAGGSSASI